VSRPDHERVKRIVPAVGSTGESPPHVERIEAARSGTERERILL
jgi:hypothetical protein